MNSSLKKPVLGVTLLIIIGISGALLAAEPDESGVGGTGHKPKIIVDPDIIEGLDIPERLEIPEAIEAFEHASEADDLSIEAADEAAPPPPEK